MEDQYIHLLISEEIFVIPDMDAVSSPTLPQQKKESFVIMTKPLSTIQKGLLGKILKSIGLQLEDVHIIYGPEDIDFAFERLLVFGENFMEPLGITQLFTPITSGQGELLISKSLTALEASREDKSKLWEALKTWFEIGS